MKRRVVMFKPRFAPLVRNGNKRQTIRPVPKRPIVRGMLLDLREWSGRPYWSKQVRIGKALCTGVSLVQIDPQNQRFPIRIDPGEPSLFYWPHPDEFASLDGFMNACDMLAWFAAEHGTGVFEGILIEWAEVSP